MSENPYSPPQSNLDNLDHEGYGEIKIFGASGRIGRVRFIAYSVGFSILSVFALALVAGIFGAAAGSPDNIDAIIGPLMLLIYLPLIVILILLTIQRLHDFDASGWWVIAVIVASLIPLVNLLATLALWVIPGTDGANRYGRKTPPNGAVSVIVAILIPLIFILILAAIAIPAYHQYVTMARVGQEIGQ